jgi:serine/threonine protein kinase
MMAELALALGHLHEHHIIHRDVKAEKVLLDDAGHVRLGDFGLAKEVWAATQSFCGTVEYMAPEIVLHKAYGSKVDWWAFGVLLYIILAGKTPFEGENEAEIYRNIVSEEPDFAPLRHRDAMDLTRALLNKKPDERPDFEQVKGHAFFRRLDWDLVLRKGYDPFKLDWPSEAHPTASPQMVTDPPPSDSPCDDQLPSECMLPDFELGDDSDSGPSEVRPMQLVLS